MENKLWSKSFIILMVITIIMYVGYNIMIAALPLQVESMGGTPSQIGLIVSLFALAALLSRPFAGWH